MTIAHAHLYRYSLPLSAPLSPHGAEEREGVLLRLVASSGAVGWGDAAPLPGFSPESLAAVVDEGRRLVRTLPGTPLPEGGGGEGCLEKWGRGEEPPSLQFAIESALVTLLAAARGDSSSQILGGGRDAVALNALISASTQTLEEEATQLRRDGYRAVKLKVGQQAPAADAARARRVRELLGPNVALRLDANRAWSLDEAVAFAEALDGLSLSYIEEPLRTPAQLSTFVDATGLPVALDETTRDHDPSAIPDDLPVHAVVLKPTLLGGLAAAREWAVWAEARGATPVVSSSYESGVGLRMLGVLASTLSDAPAGLSTYSRLTTDLLRPRLPLPEATVPVDELWASTVDRSMLRSVGDDA